MMVDERLQIYISSAALPSPFRAGISGIGLAALGITSLGISRL